jgi:stearoyl-CoA desaturase (Delta-9 desaturase)
VSEAVEIVTSEVAVATVRERTTRSSQVVMLLAIVIPPLGLVVAAVGLWGIALSWVDVAVFLALYVLTGLGTTVGYHRLFTHRSFETTKTVRATFAILGSMTIQGPVTQWVTDHRKHHALSDREGDPHSPHAGFAPNAWGALKGFVHALPHVRAAKLSLAGRKPQQLGRRSADVRRGLA